MILAALFVYLSFALGGSSEMFLGKWLIKDSKNQFKEVIQDKERSKKAMGILDEMIATPKTSTRMSRKLTKSWGNW